MGRQSVSRAVASIEDAFESHWRRFGLYPGASLHEDAGVLWYEAPIAHLPYNGVIRSRIPEGEDADAVVARVTARFRERDVPFMWVVRPSDTPSDLPHRLAQHSLDMVEQATGMELGLATWEPAAVATEARIIEALDDRSLTDYEELIRTYWSVPEAGRALIHTLNRYWGPGPRSPGTRLVAYVDDKPVAKLFLNLSEVPERCSIYGVAVLPEARGRGLATAMMETALARAKREGARTAVLHSSNMALALYRRMGFTEHCILSVFATGPIFGTHHH